MGTHGTDPSVEGARQDRVRRPLLLAAGLVAMSAVLVSVLRFGALLALFALPDDLPDVLGYAVALVFTAPHLVVLVLLVGIARRLGTWRPAGLHRIRPVADAWTLLPPAALLLVAVVVGAAGAGTGDVGAVLSADDGFLGLTAAADAVLATVLFLGIVPWLVGGGGALRTVALTAVLFLAHEIASYGVVGALGLGDLGYPLVLTAVVSVLLVVTLRTRAPWTTLPFILAVSLLPVDEGVVGLVCLALALVFAAYLLARARQVPPTPSSGTGGP